MIETSTALVLPPRDLDFIEFLIYGDQETGKRYSPEEAAVKFYGITSEQAKSRIRRLGSNPAFARAYNSVIEDWSSLMSLDSRTSRKGQIEELLKDLDRIDQIIEGRARLEEERKQKTLSKGEDYQQMFGGEETGLIAIKASKFGVEGRFDNALLSERRDIMKRILVLTGSEPGQRLEITGKNGGAIQVSNEYQAVLDKVFSTQTAIDAEFTEEVQPE